VRRCCGDVHANFDERTGTLSSTVFNKAAEYRYDGGRQRYLVRERNPNPSVPEDPQQSALDNRRHRPVA
jgi:hypothetical protein